MTTEIASNAVTGAAVGTAVVLGVKGAVAASVPLLMSTGSTVVAGVGSIMPWWMPAVQYVAGPALIGTVGVPVIVASGVGYAAYRILVK